MLVVAEDVACSVLCLSVFIGHDCRAPTTELFKMHLVCCLV